MGNLLQRIRSYRSYSPPEAVVLWSKKTEECKEPQRTRKSRERPNSVCLMSVKNLKTLKRRPAWKRRKNWNDVRSLSFRENDDKFENKESIK